MFKNYQGPSFYTVALILFLLSVTTMFYNLWLGSLYAWDEGWYGEVAREIVSEGKGWMTLHYNYHLWFQKPPLFIWMVAVAYKLFGVNEFAVRVWSALFGSACVVLLYFFTRRLFSSERAAIFSSLSLLGFAQFIKQSRMGMMDAPLTFFILLGIFVFWEGRKKERLLFFVGIITAIAFMIKSFSALLIPIIILFYAFVSREWKIITNRKLILGFFAGLLICLPWHLYEFVTHGNLFTNEYLLHHVFGRAFEGVDNNIGDIWSYFKLIVFKNFPVGWLSLLSIPYLIWHFRVERDREQKASIVLILLSITVILGLFSMMRTKLMWYIMPAYPFLSAAIGISLATMIVRLKSSSQKALTLLIVVILVTVSIGRFINDNHKTLDYSPELKTISLSAKRNSSHNDTILRYGIIEEPVVIFYSERKSRVVDKVEILKITETNEPFICIMSKDDGLFREIEKSSSEIIILAHTPKYNLYKKP